MFIPNTTCDLYSKLTTTNNFGRHGFAPKRTVKCSVIFLDITVQKSSVRADTSGSRGQADQTQGDARLLFPKVLTLKLGDVIFKDGHWLEVIEYNPMRDVLGHIDHNQAEFRKHEVVA